MVERGIPLTTTDKHIVNFWSNRSVQNHNTGSGTLEHTLHSPSNQNWKCTNVIIIITHGLIVNNYCPFGLLGRWVHPASQRWKPMYLLTSHFLVKTSIQKPYRSYVQIPIVTQPNPLCMVPVGLQPWWKSIIGSQNARTRSPSSIFQLYSPHHDFHWWKGANPSAT